MYKINVTLMDNDKFTADLLLPTIPKKGNSITCALYYKDTKYYSVFDIKIVIYTFDTENKFSHISIIVKEI